MSAAVYCALVHHPVRDRAGDTVTTAVTTIDVHDISRSARTYGLSGYFVVTPIGAQQTLVKRVLGHWEDGAGKQRMPERSDALSLCSVVDSVTQAEQAIAEQEGQAPRIVVTAARSMGRPLTGFGALRRALSTDNQPYLILFGTGHGLAMELLERAHVQLAPISGPTNFNHLSVRSAAAIVFDRLFSPPGEEVSWAATRGRAGSAYAFLQQHVDRRGSA